MSNNMSTFKRYEKKYMITEDQYHAVVHALNAYIAPDIHDKYTLCNIYYDTDTYEIIRRSIEKPAYKEKLRIRSYGTPAKGDRIFFELKKKYRKEVFKRRVSLSKRALDIYMQSGLRPDVSLQILSEIEYFMGLYKPFPRVFIAYERAAFTDRFNQNLRITFDQNIRYREDNLDLTMGDDGTHILDDSQLIMEIKVQGAFPLWLSRILNDMQIFPTSFSKYGYCYQHFITHGTTPSSGYGKDVIYA